jgi:hypothetical protein
MHQKCLCCIADRGPLGLGVDHYVQRHLHIGCSVDEDVTVAYSGLDDWDLAIAHHGVDQAGAASRNQHINESTCRHEFIGDLARTAHQLNGIRW